MEFKIFLLFGLLIWSICAIITGFRVLWKLADMVCGGEKCD